ncbi:hypothetical protein F5Y16DRAFT_404366 [Xylariaceae sp. FL0255]|nr:hypothetical protein F5Y16DRAFT_404366 [Xylariaceae sp. FL0255]
MQLMKIIMLAIPAIAARVTKRAASPSVAEYVSSNCSGSASFYHTEPYLGDVDLDNSSHSVYLTGTWKLFDEKDAGNCNGIAIATVSYPSGACISLSAELGHENLPIRCVRNCQDIGC